MEERRGAGEHPRCQGRPRKPRAGAGFSPKSPAAPPRHGLGQAGRCPGSSAAPPGRSQGMSRSTEQTLGLAVAGACPLLPGREREPSCVRLSPRAAGGARARRHVLETPCREGRRDPPEAPSDGREGDRDEGPRPQGCWRALRNARLLPPAGGQPTPRCLVSAGSGQPGEEGGVRVALATAEVCVSRPQPAASYPQPHKTLSPEARAPPGDAGSRGARLLFKSWNGRSHTIPSSSSSSWEEGAGSQCSPQGRREADPADPGGPDPEPRPRQAWESPEVAACGPSPAPHTWLGPQSGPAKVESLRTWRGCAAEERQIR